MQSSIVINKLKQWPRSLLLKSVVVPTIVIFILSFCILQENKAAFLITLATAFVSWNNSQIISNLSFKRSEVSKSKDSIFQDVEKFFDLMGQLFLERRLNEDQLETELSSRLSILEMRSQHIEKRTGIVLIDTEVITQLRIKLPDLLDKDSYKTQLIKMRFDSLEDIESKYSDWHDRH